MPIVLVFVCGVICGALSAPAFEESQAVIRNFDNNIDEHGNYNFSFRTSNGIERSETGEVNNAGSPDEYIVVNGEYSYTDPEGKFIEVRYYADKDGFHILPPLYTTPIPVLVPAAGPVNGNVVASLLG